MENAKVGFEANHHMDAKAASMDLSVHLRSYRNTLGICHSAEIQESCPRSFEISETLTTMTPNKTSSSAGSDDGQFDKTLWSLVLGAVQSRAPCAQKALAELCGLYWRPLYAFARRRGHSPEDAQDLVQGFFEHLIGSRGLVTVEKDSLRDGPVFFV